MRPESHDKLGDRKEIEGMEGQIPGEEYDLAMNLGRDLGQAHNQNQDKK